MSATKVLTLTAGRRLHLRERFCLETLLVALTSSLQDIFGHLLLLMLMLHARS